MTLKADLPTWTSLLYLPAHEARPSATPLGCRPDGVVLDLEDFVPWHAKPAAREALPANVAGFTDGGIDVVVRINRALDLAVADIDRAVLPGVRALMLTKLASADHVRLLDEYVATLETRRGLVPGGIRFIGMVESAGGMRQIDAIAGACERMAGLTLGGEDLARECRMRSTEATLLHPKQSLVQASAAAGILPWGTLASVVDFRDAQGFRAMAERSRDFGFRVSTCLRAAQVEVVNQIYAPQPDELAWAGRVLDAAADSSGLPVEPGERAQAEWIRAVHARRTAVAAESLETAA